MGKINIKSVLENINEKKFFCNETVGILKDNKIKYIDNFVTVIISIEKDKITITRRSDEYTIVLPLEEGKTEKGVYDITSLGILDLEVYTEKLKINNNFIDVEYTMVTDKENKIKFKFRLEYGEEL